MPWIRVLDEAARRKARKIEALTVSLGTENRSLGLQNHSLSMLIEFSNAIKSMPSEQKNFSVNSYFLPNNK